MSPIVYLMATGNIIGLLLLISLTLSSELIYGLSSSHVSQPDHHSFSRYTHRRAAPKHSVPAGRPKAAEGAAGDSPVQLDILEKYVVINNGILELTLTNPGGVITCINYNGIDNLLESLNEEIDRGYWDMVWSDDNTTRKKGNFDRLFATKLNVVEQNEEKVEVSFVKTWDPSLEGQEVPLNIDKRFVVLRGSSGFYSYAIYGRPRGWPSFDLDNTRIAFKLRKDKFNYMAITDKRQRQMPLPDDRLPGRGEPLAYPEAVLLVNPVEPEFKGEVDDKYQYSCEQKDILVHGWISKDDRQPVGFWQITPSNEFRSGGPLKQSLTSHVGPTSLTIFHSTHYAGAEMIMHFGRNEPWEKVYGPVFVYLNSVSSEGGDPLSLWEDAKKQASVETKKWPYDFLAAPEFPSSAHRGSVSGTLFVNDRTTFNEKNQSASGAYIILAIPGLVGSSQIETKGYQFWTEADESGSFKIENIRPGEYNLYASVPGFIGDYMYNTVINIRPGESVELGDIVYKPLRNGPTLWEIGKPDRSAAEFFIPMPNPKYINKLYLHQDLFRQYGLWERYADLYPPERDLVFTIGFSDFRKDWFFAHVTRKTGNATYEGVPWQIKFTLDDVDHTGKYILRLALATANGAELEVRVNDLRSRYPLFYSGKLGHDNTIARHGIHGLYRLLNVEIPGAKMQRGVNTIYLALTSNVSPFQGVMYDYIRLESPFSN